MSKAVRLSDIAARVGVSTVTVSKALSGQKGMSSEVRTRILATAQEMGYVKGEARRSSVEKRTGFRIGLLVAERYLGKYVTFYAHLQQLVAAETDIFRSHSRCSQGLIHKQLHDIMVVGSGQSLSAGVGTYRRSSYGCT